MIAYRQHFRQIVVQVVFAVAGLLAGIGAALASTRNVNLGVDPVGLVGTWVGFVIVCGALGWMLGTEVEETRHH